MRLLYRFCLYSILGFILSIGLSLNIVGMAQNPDADSLNQRGFTLLDQGAAVDAVSVWEEAETIYRVAGNDEGVVGVQLNQALAQQALGLHPLACTTLVEALEISERLCKPSAGQELVVSELATVEDIPVNTIGIRLLGEGLGLLSNLEESVAALLIAQERVVETSPEKMSISLALGNSYKLLFQSAWQGYSRFSYREIALRERKISEAVELSNEAIKHYESVSGSSDPGLAVKADLNILGMLAYVLDSESELSPEVDLLIDGLIQSAQQSCQRLGVDEVIDFSQLPAIDSIYTMLNLATNLSIVKASRYSHHFRELISSKEISDLIEKSTFLAERIGDRRSLSVVSGIYGDHLQSEGLSTTLIKAQYRKALSIAQSIQADDLSYAWAYQLAKIAGKERNLDQAEQYYQLSISALSNVRSDLLAVDSELRFNFQRKIEPVYQDYMQFLITQEKSDFQKVVETHSSLQLAQIENLLRCGRLVRAPANQKTTIHLINLENTSDTIEVIVSQDENLYGYSIPAPEILRTAESLASNAQSPRFLSIPESEFLPYSQFLYDELIRPAVQHGFVTEGSEITFVLDAPFQSIPMGLLHDGQKYLAASHPLSISFQMQKINQPVEGSGALFVGLSESSPSFNSVSEFGEFQPILDTEFEASYVSRYVNSRILLNQDFTADNLGAEVSQTDFQIVHISTHSQFSSDPEGTFLLAWDRPIDASEFGEIFQKAKSIDLLFLSACQTAAGDERSSLGLAGLSIQSGARNAVASLWLVDSVATSVLVDRFYEALANDLDPAKALQQAQISLINSSDDAFKHPYYWASFTLAAS